MLELSERAEPVDEQPDAGRAAAHVAGARLQATSTRRALLLTALGGLLIAGVDHRAADPATATA